MIKKLSYKQKIVLNTFVIILGIIAWYFACDAPYLGQKHRFDSLLKSNFSSNAQVIYEYREKDDPHHETHYILNSGNDYAYFNLYDFKAGNSYKGGPTRKVVDLYFEDGLSVISMSGERGETVTTAEVAVISVNKDVETVEVEYHSGSGIVICVPAERETDEVFRGAVKIPGIRLGLEHWSAELYNGDFTAKGYDKDGNLIAVNKCQAHIMEEKLNEKN